MEGNNITSSVVVVRGVISESIILSNITSNDFTNFLDDNLRLVNNNIIVLDNNFTRLVSLSKTSAAVNSEETFIGRRPSLRVVSVTTVLTLENRELDNTTNVDENRGGRIDNRTNVNEENIINVRVSFKVDNTDGSTSRNSSQIQ